MFEPTYFQTQLRTLMADASVSFKQFSLSALAKFIIFGKQHLDYLVAEFTAYYNHHRSHSERDSLPPIRKVPHDVDVLSMQQMAVKSPVGGLVKSFERAA